MDFLEFNKKFPTEEKAIEYFINIRYGDQIVCPYCGCIEKIYRRGNKRNKDFVCNNCNNEFSIFRNTIFEKSSTDIRIWFYAINQVLIAKKGISALQLQRETGVTYKTAWKILNQIRKAMGNDNDKKLFEACVEIDETYVGGKPRKKSKKDDDDNDKNNFNKRGRGTNKTPVVGIKERNSNNVQAVVALPNEQNKRLTGMQLLEILNKVCEKDCLVITDDFKGYGILDKETNEFVHLSVNHSINEFSKGNGVHTNGIESFWAVLKRGIYGIYHHVSVKHLQRYVDEFCFRANYKDTQENFDIILRNCILI